MARVQEFPINMRHPKLATTLTWVVCLRSNLRFFQLIYATKDWRRTFYQTGDEDAII